MPERSERSRQPRPRADRGSERRDELGTAASLLVAVVVVGVLVAAVVTFFTVHVCDEQLSDDGSAVEVCRHLQASDPPVIALGLLALVALGLVFTEVSGFGFTLRRQVNEVQRVAAEAKELGTANREELRETAADLTDLGQRTLTRAEGLDRGLDDRPSPVRELADEYDRIRLTNPSGASRTAQMEEVVARMQSALATVEDFDVGWHLAGANRGLRLAAYASLQASPEPRWAAGLVESLIDREDTAFGQWWGLLALRSLCGRDPSSLRADARRRLEEELRPRLQPASDRWWLLQDVLQACAF